MANEYDAEDYTVENGTVIDIRPDEIVVRVEKNDADCGGCRSCAMKNLCRGRDTGHLDLPVPLAPGADAAPDKGQQVRIAYRPTNAAVAALVMFLPALVGLLVGGAAGQRLGGESEALLVAGCFIGFAAGVGVSFLLARYTPSLKPDVRLLSE